MVIKILTGLERRVDELTENFEIETENIKKNLSEMKNTIAEMKNTLHGINSRLQDAEWTSDLGESSGKQPR